MIEVMFMRTQVQVLLGKGHLPNSKSDISIIQDWQQALEKIKPPLSDEEAIALTRLFPNDQDECYGLAWTLVHLVESAPSWPIQDCLREKENPWIAHLRQAAGLGLE